MPTRKRTRRYRWNRTTWMMLWSVRGRPQQLDLLDLLTIPEEAFEHHSSFYAGDEQHPIASIYRSRMHYFDAGEPYFVYGSSHGGDSSSLPRACKNLWEKLRVQGVPAWYGKVVEARLRRPGYFDRTVRRRP